MSRKEDIEKLNSLVAEVNALAEKIRNDYAEEQEDDVLAKYIEAVNSGDYLLYWVNSSGDVKDGPGACVLENYNPYSNYVSVIIADKAAKMKKFNDMLPLDEAIKHCEVVAEQEECFINYPHSDIVLGDLDIESRKHYVAEQKQLAEWLTELKERREWCAQYEVEQISNLEQYDMLSRECEILNERYKEAVKLLKAAVEGYSFIGHITKDYACPSAISCSACPMDEGKQCRIWEHADEALALIREVSDTE